MAKILTALIEVNQIWVKSFTEFCFLCKIYGQSPELYSSKNKLSIHLKPIYKPKRYVSETVLLIVPETPIRMD